MQELLCLVLKPYPNSRAAVNVVKHRNTILKQVSCVEKVVGKIMQIKEAANMQIFTVGLVIASLGAELHRKKEYQPCLKGISELEEK